MAQYRSTTEFSYCHSEQGKTIGRELVELEKDGWVQAQLDAGLIIEIGGGDKPAKGKKEAAAE